MTDIDQAFRKAYAKRVTGDSASVVTPAVWLDEESGKTYREDSGHAVARPHTIEDETPRLPVESASQNDADRKAEPDNGKPLEQRTPAIDNKVEETSSPESTAASKSLDVEVGTTAYDAWKEKLKGLPPAEIAAPSKEQHFPQTAPPAKADLLVLKFSPVWEVDEFATPSIAKRLVNEHLSGIGSQLERACREGLQTLAICSRSRGTGRSTVAIAIAQTAAKSGLRVALVDGDIENPTLVEKLQLDMNIDWVDVVAQGMSIEEATVQSIGNGFSFLPLLRKSPDQLNRVDQYAKDLFEGLKRHYDLIVVDNSPFDEGSFGRSIPITSDVFDAVMLVEDIQEGDTDSLEACARRIRAIGIDNIGLIENFSSAVV